MLDIDDPIRDIIRDLRNYISEISNEDRLEAFDLISEGYCPNCGREDVGWMYCPCKDERT